MWKQAVVWMVLLAVGACSDASPSAERADAGAAPSDVATSEVGPDTVDDVTPPDRDTAVEPIPDVAVPDADDAGCDSLGCPCEEDVDCASGYCINGPDDGSVCSELCNEGCTEPGYACRLLVNASGDAVRLCVPERSTYCASCETAADCGDLTSVCQPLDDGSTACLPFCDDATLCPAGSSCTDLGAPSRLCVPDIGICRGCVDFDGDLHGVGPDCLGADADDNDDTVYDGAPELCDTLDNDGDGEVDEGFDLQTSPIHCGTCGNECGFPNANAVCVDGACAIESCLEGFADCNGSLSDGCEVDTTSNPFNCGGCGPEFDCERPNADTECVESVCTIVECDGRFGDCDLDASNGCESDLLSDLDHCSACGTVCAFEGAEAQCSGGVCGLGGCETGFADCDANADNGCETSIVDNDDACGGCGLVCDPENGAGACVGTICELSGCFGDYLDCDGDPFTGCEVDGDTSLSDCGACGNACSAENGSATCDRGVCEVESCRENYDDCDGEYGNGCETFLIDNIVACGACGAACAPAPNAEVECDGTTCRISACTPGFADCNGNYADGCEANLTRPETCLSCDNVCAFANGVAGCDVSGCALLECLPGFFNADRNAANGCEYRCEVTNGGVEICDTLDNDCDGEVDEGFALQTDEANCGACGVTCEAAQAAGTCIAGVCEFACLAPWGNCDGDIRGNGCEVNLASDPNNCNSCDAVCALPGGTNACVEGACTISECVAPFADCTAAAGCETNVATSLTNCGACGIACSTANVARGRCVDGVCVIDECNRGYGDCDGVASNGCETNLLNDPNDCGICGTVCENPNGSSSCRAGNCSPSCSSGFGDCDGNVRNGCELRLNTLSNCGTCGGVCALANASESCSTGDCLVTSCTPGYCNNNGSSADGCEFDLDTSPVCESFEDLGTVNGDSGNATITRQAFGERRFRVRVNEGDSSPVSCSDLGVTITLTPSAGTDYDLQAWCENCDGDNRSSSAGGSAQDSVILRWDEECVLGTFPAGTDSGRTITILVRYFSGNTCAPYTLQVTGNLYSGDNTCGSR